MTFIGVASIVANATPSARSIFKSSKSVSARYLLIVKVSRVPPENAQDRSPQNICSILDRTGVRMYLKSVRTFSGSDPVRTVSTIRVNYLPVHHSWLHMESNTRPRRTCSVERDKALDMALAQIERQFGEGSVMKMGERGQMKVEAVSSGSLAIDMALGIGGLPRGRVVEVFGPEASGKSTLAMHVVAEAQRTGGICAYVDAEHAMDPDYAKNIGVDVDELLISQPDTGEQALEITYMLIRSGAIDVVVIDSVAALTPRAEIEGEMGDTHVGLQARLMSQALRKITANLNKTKTICIFINQLREKIGVMFGSPETTPGGRALKFYSSARVDVRRIATLKDGALAIGIRMKARIVKNKIAPPFRIAEFDMLSSCGISLEADVLDMAVEDRIVQRCGSWFSYGETRL